MHATQVIFLIIFAFRIFHNLSNNYNLLYLFFSILSSTAVVVIFKFIERHRVNTFNAIIINYIAALSLGFGLNRTGAISDISFETWLGPAIVIGILFVVMFYIIGLTAQKVGVTVSSVAGKMSVVTPIIFSIIYYNEPLGPFKVAGLVLALTALVFTSIRHKSIKIPPRYMLLPFILFIGSGIVDSLVKFTQDAHIDDSNIFLFSAVLFSCSAFSGLVARGFTKTPFKTLFKGKTLFLGTLLGISNWGTLFFFVNALNHSPLDSSVVFALNNIGIVALTAFSAIIIFNERLTKLNWLGIIFSFIAIYILAFTYQQI